MRIDRHATSITPALSRPLHIESNLFQTFVLLISPHYLEPVFQYFFVPNFYNARSRQSDTTSHPHGEDDQTLEHNHFSHIPILIASYQQPYNIGADTTSSHINL